MTSSEQLVNDNAIRDWQKANDLLIAKVRKMRKALGYTLGPLEVISKLGRCAQGGEQTGNQMHVWEAVKIIKEALKD
jgi:hypothetical protein